MRRGLPNATKIDLVFQHRYVRHWKGSIPEFLINSFGYNDPINLFAVGQMLLYPPHISQKLTDGTVRTTCKLQFEHDKIAFAVQSQDVYAANIRGEFNPGT